MFSNQSVLFLIKTWHPDYYLEKGFLQVIKQIANEIIYKIGIYDMQGVKEAVNNKFPKYIFNKANTYLKNWEKINKLVDLENIKHSRNINGIYPWPITLKLNPQKIQNKLKKKFMMKDKEYAKVSAYITNVVELVLWDVFTCIDHKRYQDGVYYHPKISLSHAQQCSIK